MCILRVVHVHRVPGRYGRASRGPVSRGWHVCPRRAASRRRIRRGLAIATRRRRLCRMVRRQRVFDPAERVKNGPRRALDQRAAAGVGWSSLRRPARARACDIAHRLYRAACRRHGSRGLGGVLSVLSLPGLPGGARRRLAVADGPAPEFPATGRARRFRALGLAAGNQNPCDPLHSCGLRGRSVACRLAGGGWLLAERMANLAPWATAVASASEEKSALLNDESNNNLWRRGTTASKGAHCRSLSIIRN